MKRQSVLLISLGALAAILAALEKYISLSTKVVAAFETFHQTIKDAFGLTKLSPAYTVAFLLSIVLLVVASFVVPRWLDRQRAGRLRRNRDEAAKLADQARKGRVFSLEPHEPPSDLHERIAFDRPDGEHERVLEWIRKTRHPVVYVLGFSGCGKSSLMGAYVVPMLNREGLTPDGAGGSTTLAVMVRAFGDVTATLRSVFTEPGCVWEVPPDLSELNARQLLERVATRLADKCRRLVLVFDQFEEVLVSGSPQPKAQPAAIALVMSLQQEPIKDVCCVLIARAEYGKDFAPLGLPQRIERDTFMDIPAFSVSDAAVVFEQALDKIHGKKTAHAQTAMSLAREAETLGKVPQYVTPITLNMIGFMYESDPALGQRLAASGSSSIEGLLPTYVRGRISSGDLKDAGPAVLSQLVSLTGDRVQPVELATLAQHTGTLPGAIETTLLTLARHGLVRRVGPAWEVAHDFLAPLIRRALDQLSTSLWRQVKPWLPAATAVLAAVVMVGVWGLSQSQRVIDSNAFNECAKYVRSDGTVLVDGLLTGAAARHVGRIGNVRTVMFSDDDDNINQSLLNLVVHTSPLTALAKLELGNTQITDRGLAALASNDSPFTALASLSLHDTQITDLGLTALAAKGSPLSSLASLDLRNTPITDEGIAALAAKDSPLSALATLDLSNDSLNYVRTNITAQGIAALAAKDSRLSAITTLDLSNTNVDDDCLAALAAKDSSLTALTNLNIGRTAVSDQGLAILAAKDSPLTSLTTLDLRGNQINDRGLAALAAKDSPLTALTTLDLRATHVADDGLAALAAKDSPLTALTTLNLWGTQVTDRGLAALAATDSPLTNLTTLYVSGTQITDQGIAALKRRFPNIRIYR